MLCNTVLCKCLNKNNPPSKCLLIKWWCIITLIGRFELNKYWWYYFEVNPCVYSGHMRSLGLHS